MRSLIVLACFLCVALAAQLTFHSYTNSDCSGTELTSSIGVNHCFGAFGEGAQITAQNADTVQFWYVIIWLRMA